MVPDGVDRMLASNKTKGDTKMKKLLSLFLALLLVLTGVYAAVAEEVVFSTDYYSLTLPGDWVIDTENLASSEEMQELGHFFDPQEKGLLINAYLLITGDVDDSIWNAEEGTYQDYVDMLLQEFEDSNPEMKGIIQAGGVPFVLIKCSDDYGEFLYAETIHNGMVFEFEAYVTDDAGTQYVVTEEYQELFQTILESFQPLNV